MNRTLLWALLAVMAGSVVANCFWSPSTGHVGECRIPGIIADGDDEDFSITRSFSTVPYTSSSGPPVWLLPKEFPVYEDCDALDDQWEDGILLWMVFPSKTIDERLVS